MNWARKLLSAPLIEAVEAGSWVVTPSQQSAHRLRLLYANYCVSEGRTAWLTPAIHSFDAFEKILWRAQRDESRDTDARVLTSQQSKLIWERVVAGSEWSSKLLSPQLAATGAFRSFERLQNWRIERHELVRHLDSNDEAHALLDWSDRFADVCQKQGWLPEALLGEQLLKAPLRTSFQRLLAIGEFLPLQEAILAKIKDSGVRVDRHAASRKNAEIRILSADSTDQEIQWSAEWARAQLSQGANSIGVAIPQLSDHAAQVKRIFSEVFAQSTRLFELPGTPITDAVSFTVATVHRLDEFPIVRSALDILQLVNGKASGGLVGSVLRSPFLAQSTEEGSHRALADRKLREDKREEYDIPAIERLTAAAGCTQLNSKVRVAEELRLGLPARAMPSAIAEQIVAIWNALGWPGDRVLNSNEQQVAARLQACLGEFGALDELLGPLTYSSAVREFEQQVRNTNFEPRTLPAPVTVFDVRSMQEQTFEALWVAGMDESRWPPAPQPDPYIPMELQLRSQMPEATARTMREYARRQFECLMHSAERIVFSWPSKDEDVDLLPSPWLSEFEMPSERSAQQVLALSAEKHWRSVDPFAARTFAARPTLEVWTEESGPRYVLPRARGGARLFELQSQCPFRSFAELRLRSEALEALTPSIDARDRGMLIHAALATLWQHLKSSDGLAETKIDELTTMVRTTVARHAAPLFVGVSSHRMRMLQIEQELAVERILALLELDRERAPFRVAGQPEMKEEVTVNGLEFELRLDRVDEVLTGSVKGSRVIVDYKTGSKITTSTWFKDRPEQPQLPLYAVTHPIALAAVVFATVSAQNVGYQGVARDEMLFPGIKKFDGKDLPAPFVEWSGLLEFWRSIIERLAEEFLKGDARVDPLSTACRYCHLSTLCRIHELALEVADASMNEMES